MLTVWVRDMKIRKNNFFYYKNNYKIIISERDYINHFYIVVIENCMNARGQKSPVDEGRKVAGLYVSFTESPSTQSS